MITNHMMVGRLTENSTDMTGICTRCLGIAHVDLPRACPGRFMSPLESANVYLRKLEYINSAWQWNPTIDRESHGEPPPILGH